MISENYEKLEKIIRGQKTIDDSKVKVTVKTKNDLKDALLKTYNSKAMDLVWAWNPPIQVKFEKIHPDAIAPKQATANSAGFDLFSVENDFRMRTGDTYLIRTGIRVELPPGHMMYISSKSGLASQEKLFVLNSPGLLDQDYRGEIKVILYKAAEGFGEYSLIKKSQKIAQFVILPYPQVELVEGVVSTDTERGEGGFGSTGKF